MVPLISSSTDVISFLSLSLDMIVRLDNYVMSYSQRGIQFQGSHITYAQFRGGKQ